MPLLLFVKYAYVLALASVVILELTNSGRVARYAARLAIVITLCGSSTWVYAAYFAPHTNSTTYVRPANHKPAPAGDAEDHDGMDLGGEFDPEASGGKSGHGRKAGARDVDADGPIGGWVHKAGVVLGLADDAPADLCPHCPDMVRVTAGASPIGAPESDAAATAAELPQQVVRIWPGFAISREAISKRDFDAFLSATGRTKQPCTAPLASVASGTLSSNDLSSTRTARCISAADAEAYASWLTASTGQRFRLPTAVEWEYAVRMTEPASLKVGEVAEVVADCWTGRLPVPLSARSESVLCDERMVKGAAAIDEARWHRPSARRMLDAGMAPLDVGFRLVQED